MTQGPSPTRLREIAEALRNIARRHNAVDESSDAGLQADRDRFTLREIADEIEASGAPVTTLHCRVCGVEQVVRATANRGVDINSAALAGWSYASDTGWVCPSQHESGGVADTPTDTARELRDGEDTKSAGWCTTHNDFAWIYDDDSLTCLYCLVVETGSDGCEVVPASLRLRAVGQVERTAPPTTSNELAAFLSEFWAAFTPTAGSKRPVADAAYGLADALLARYEITRRETP